MDARVIHPQSIFVTSHLSPSLCLCLSLFLSLYLYLSIYLYLYLNSSISPGAGPEEGSKEGKRERKRVCGVPLTLCTHLIIIIAAQYSNMR